MASFTARRASVHLYFSSLPIDLRVVVLEPGITEDHVLLPEARDSIYEVAHSSGVQKRFNGVHLAGVCGADFYWEDDRRSTGVKGIDGELFG